MKFPACFLKQNQLGCCKAFFMKKIFALFCAVCLMPGFSAQAWIGGPFSGNSFFQAEDNDGVYEATASTLNGIGIYRFAVGNNFDGVNSSSVNATVPSQITLGSGTIITQPGISSGNVVIGAWGNGFTNVWYYQGVQYFGTTMGTVNSMSGRVFGMATSRDGGGLGVNSLSSMFTARIVRGTKWVAATPFVGVGEATPTSVLGPGTPFKFTILGSKVSNKLTLGL